MDISKEYILMCEKVECIQLYWGTGKGWTNGDFVCRKKDMTVYVLYSNEHHGFPPEKYLYPNSIWLPRQDQLQKIVEDLLPEWRYNIFELLRAFFNYLQLENDVNPAPYCNTLEKLWLAFVMKEKYNKVWNGKEWIKDA